VGPRRAGTKTKADVAACQEGPGIGEAAVLVVEQSIEPVVPQLPAFHLRLPRYGSGLKRRQGFMSTI
jgi:hypothetical protein